MIVNHHSRKQRQLKYLVKKLTILLKNKSNDVKSEIKKLTAKIKYLVNQLNTIISNNKMKRILAGVALIIGVSFTNTANAQWFSYPIQDPFNLQDGNDEEIINPEFADLDNDGDLDYLSGEYILGALGYGLGFRFQENIGSSTIPNFSNAVINPFGLTAYTFTFPEIGIRQNHKFIDLDNDGDFDILSNLISINYNTYTFSSDFLYYENIGSTSAPQFTNPVSNQFGLTSSPTIIYTTFGDIDNDGDTDILGFSYDYSTYNANFLFIENIGSASVPNFTTPQLNVFGIPSGIWATLALEDIDTDGDLDIMFTDEGYYSTDFGFVENIGTALAPQYNPLPTLNPFGLSYQNWQGGGILNFKDLDGDGDNDLIIGTDDDFISYLENVGIQQPITYECVNYSCVDPGTGNGSYATLSDCQTSCTPPASFECNWPGNCYDPADGSGFYTSYNDCMNDCTPQPSWDCISAGNCQDPGDESGQFWSLQDCENYCILPVTWNCDAILGCVDPTDGTGLYTSLSGCQANCNTTEVGNKQEDEIILFPNPAKNKLNIILAEKILKIEIYDVIGRIVLINENPSSIINIEQLNSGVYTIAITLRNNKILKRFTK